MYLFALAEHKPESRSGVESPQCHSQAKLEDAVSQGLP